MKIIKFYKEIIIAFIIGSIFFQMMSLSIKRNTNCSYLTNIWTDIFSFVIGVIIIYNGVYNYDDWILVMIGTIIITEHIWQVIYHKVNK
jgi:hypothetical protein